MFLTHFFSILSITFILLDNNLQKNLFIIYKLNKSYIHVYKFS